MRIRWVKHGRIARDVEAALKLAWKRLRPGFPLHKNLTVELVPGEVVVCQLTGMSGFACIMPDAKCITVGAMVLDRGATRGLSIRSVVESFCHELGHYEQDREGKPMNERGIDKRMNRLTAIALGLPEGSFGNGARS